MLIRAALISACLMAAAAVVGRAATTEQVLVRTPLAEFPLVFDQWAGKRTQEFDQRTLEMLGVDEYINRVYIASTGRPLWLYVGFYGSQREGDTMHSPLNCLPGSGWEPLHRTRVRIALPATAAAQDVEVNQILVQNGAERLLILYWYQTRGQVIASEYWSKVSAVFNTIRYNRSDAAMIRITVPVSDDTDLAAADAARFVGAVFPRLRSHLPS